MARIVTAALLCLWLAQARAEVGTSGGTSFSIGPSGVTFGAPGLEQGFGIRNEGNGVYSTSFSLSGAAARATGATGAPARVLPPIQIGPSSGVLTDSNAFFRGVGKKPDAATASPSRRPRAPALGD